MSKSLKTEDFDDIEEEIFDDDFENFNTGLKENDEEFLKDIGFLDEGNTAHDEDVKKSLKNLFILF